MNLNTSIGVGKFWPPKRGELRNRGDIEVHEVVGQSVYYGTENI